MDQLLIECYNWIYEQPNKSCSYQQLADYIYTLNKPDLEFKNFEDLKLKFNDQVRLKYQELTNCYQLPYFDNKTMTVINLLTSTNPYDQLIKQNQLTNVLVNHNEFKSTSDTDIYILSLNFFHVNWINGVSFFEYKHYVLNVIKIDVLDERLRQLYREITKQPDLYNEHYKKIASLDSMLGLLEYIELQHSLKESKEAKISSKNANYLAIFGILLSVIGLAVSIYYSREQMDLTKEQFKIEQQQYLKEYQKNNMNYIKPTNPIIKPK